MFTIKNGDTSPALRAVLKYDDGSVVNLTDASVRFHMRRYGEETVLIDEPASVVSIAGIVEYPWIVADTDEVGKYEGEFEVTYSDDTIETFPSNGYIRIDVVKAIA